MSSVDPNLLRLVATHPFLAGLQERQIEILAECAQVQQFAPDQMVFRAGDPAKGFYLLESGSIAVEGGAEGEVVVPIDTVAAGEPLGWSWIFEPFVCQYGARTIEPTTAIFIDALRLAEHRGGDLTLGHELFKRMSQV
ncbi:MAG: cyclic nucleotide-binding domain-containing protein, partial [Verrucomicrobiota bacterium]|nr:cyclic nucleotide-binding domain-containing protein [Verrucomicrobiota bacterium]